MAAPAEGMQQVAENFILQQFHNKRSELQAYSQRLGELEMNQREHNLVITALEKLPRERRCFRLVGGVLVERTVNEVEPALRKNLEKLAEVIQNMEDDMKVKEDELAAFATKYHIQPKQSDDE
mmetsp:Transcript_55803/g.92687  ORF Transcript_55803/g.92687 Transcript_55803/m.92687 type:complete len:123 (+) Transcript_55803:16-384(+)|eukprot:CAMPEP_0184348776 /NCGR_PEP_ID=MMETSP1089-20130417/30198_1 /TAXON_ID=38269 ORGANISM="Gloeochaete wittrockiana, Strain SAG46.84" /NCGR_SAMPLE_ID=MMETSP1089 /ASSEMBLY_ACC=CAM_ASM_000445 /LENGTH=122 /DNA_ID=CAMNT_0026680683 /DNA_START=16 /DNA_END=384 /DNA_ORIENTATION=+